MAQQQLKRLLGKGFSIAACIGLIVGLGIMRTPGEIARTVTDPVLYMGLWIAGGFFVLLTVLTAAELFSMTPKSGGVYALVRNAYGPYPGFVIGWTDVMASCAAGAVKAVVLTEYLALLIPGLEQFIPHVAVAVTTVFAALQLGGLRLGSKIQQTASVVFGLIMVGLAGALFYGFLSFGQAAMPPSESPIANDMTVFAQWGLVITAIVFTYDGWFAPTYFSGEMKAGPRDAAGGAIRGVLFVIAFYVALNLALVLAVPLEALVGHDLALSGAIDIVFGNGVGTVVVFAAIFILLSHQNLQYMNVSRTIYALSVDGLGTDKATSVSQSGTPTVAVVLAWICMAGLITQGGFAFLLGLTTFLLMLTYLGVLLGVFRLRRIRPDAERPFKAWGYPWVSGVMLVCWIGVVAFVGITNPKSVLYALLLIAVSAPAYWWMKRLHHLSSAAAAET